MAIFQNWEATLEQLVSAIDHYHDTLTAFETAIERPHDHHPNNSSLEDDISGIYERRTFIRSKSDELYKLNFRLERLRNRSRKQVPINTLPLEILSRIFTIACGSGCFVRSKHSSPGYTTRDTPETLLALTKVCSGWRRIMIDTPSFWSHIDIYQWRPWGHQASENVRPGGPVHGLFAPVRPPRPPGIVPDHSLWLDRARNTPLSVHISSHSPHVNMPWNHLKPIFPRLGATTSLSLGPTESARWLISTFDLWMSSVPSGNLRSLTVLGSNRIRENLRVCWTGQVPGQETLQACFTPIRSLCLHGAYFDWDSPAYHGLVDLKISGMNYRTSMTKEQMVSILRACPDLRVLQLEGINVQSELQVSYDPVLLNKLEVLDVTRMNVWPLKEVLSIIDPGPGELSVRIDFRHRESNLVLQTFCSRSNIIRLFLHGSDLTLAYLTEYLNSLSNLRVLLLDLGIKTQLAGREAELDRLVQALGDPNSALCPHLRTLYLIDCKPSLENVKKLVESCGIEKLRILSSTQEMNPHIEQWSEKSARDTKQKSNVDIEALAEDWYEHT